MTDDLQLNGGWGRLFSDWGSAVLGSLQTKGEINKNQRSLAVSNRTYKPLLSDAAFVQEIIDGVPGPEYRLYGEHNKPTAADVGAIPIGGNAGRVECPSIDGNDVLEYALSCPPATTTSFRWSTDATNAPSAWCHALAMRNGSDDCNIIAFAVTTGEMYTNVAVNGVWKGWKKVTMTAI